MMARSWVVISAKKMRRAMAAPMPQKMTLRRCSSGTVAAAMPTTMALSPARTRSMAMTCPRAANWTINRNFPLFLFLDGGAPTEMHRLLLILLGSGRCGRVLLPMVAQHSQHYRHQHKQQGRDQQSQRQRMSEEDRRVALADRQRPTKLLFGQRTQ